MCTGLEVALLAGGSALVGSKLLAPKVPPAPSIPARDNAQTEEARRKQREAELRRKGRASTILTGGSGVTEDPTLSRPELLG